MAKDNGKRRNGAVGINDVDAFVLLHSPTIIAAITVRRDGLSANEMVDHAVFVCQQIHNLTDGATARDEYVRRNAPNIIAAMMIRRPSTNGNDLVEPAVSICQRIWDVVHEMDAPAEAMLSQPVSLRQ